jgi:hypothetical protein
MGAGVDSQADGAFAASESSAYSTDLGGTTADRHSPTAIDAAVAPSARLASIVPTERFRLW